jgi:hypothetical protein
MRTALLASCLIALGCASGSALSSDRTFELTEISGKVLVTTPEGVLPATAGQQLGEGTRIFVGEDSSAQLASTDGTCTAALPPKKVTVINSQKLCDVTITPTSNDVTGGVPPPVVGIAFFAVVTGAAIYTWLDNDNNNKPISPP